MIGIVFATLREADPFLSRTLAEPLSGGPVALFQTRREDLAACIVAVSGMGKVAAALAAAHLVQARGVSVLINAGLCGRLNTNRSWSAGELLRVSAAVEGDCDRFGKPEPSVACDPRWFESLEPARLVTCDRPVFDPVWRTCLAGSGDLADMEGAAVARAAGLYGIPCAMVKGISDAADEAGRQRVAENIDWVSARMAETLVRELTLNLADRLP